MSLAFRQSRMRVLPTVPRSGADHKTIGNFLPSHCQAMSIPLRYILSHFFRSIPNVPHPHGSRHLDVFAKNILVLSIYFRISQRHFSSPNVISVLRTVFQFSQCYFSSPMYFKICQRYFSSPNIISVLPVYFQFS